MFGLFFLYGWANIPLTYLLAYIFKSPSTGFAIIVILYLLTSQASIVAVNVLTLPGIDLKDVADVLEWLFLILLPNFSFGQGITDIYQNYEFTGICKKVIDQLPPNIPLEFACLALPNPCCIGLKSGCGVDDKNKPIPCLPWNKNYMAWEKPGLGRYFTFMTLQFVVLFSLVFIYELGLLRKIFYVIKTLFCSSPSEESQNIDIHYKQKAEEELFGDIQKDSDVLEEENRIKTEKNDLLCIDQLTKYYGDFMAVKGISVGIQPGECFGLLG
jgi:ATP-binding cassette subfamily A (ABC1) protein 3